MTAVLLIEDDAWQRQHYTETLTREGFVVTASPHALAAIGQIDQARPDVIVLDLMLPGVNGMALLHELRSHSDLAAIPIIMMSTQPSLQESQLAPYGVVAVLDKTTMQHDAIAVAIRKALV